MSHEDATKRIGKLLIAQHSYYGAHGFFRTNLKVASQVASLIALNFEDVDPDYLDLNFDDIDAQRFRVSAFGPKWILRIEVDGKAVVGSFVPRAMLRDLRVLEWPNPNQFSSDAELKLELSYANGDTLVIPSVGSKELNLQALEEFWPTLRDDLIADRVEGK
jgi:hypothetical protein